MLFDGSAPHPRTPLQRRVDASLLRLKCARLETGPNTCAVFKSDLCDRDHLVQLRALFGQDAVWTLAPAEDARQAVEFEPDCDEGEPSSSSSQSCPVPRNARRLGEQLLASALLSPSARKPVLRVPLESERSQRGRKSVEVQVSGELARRPAWRLHARLGGIEAEAALAPHTLQAVFRQSPAAGKVYCVATVLSLSKADTQAPSADHTTTAPHTTTTNNTAQSSEPRLSARLEGVSILPSAEFAELAPRSARTLCEEF